VKLIRLFKSILVVVHAFSPLYAFLRSIFIFIFSLAQVVEQLPYVFSLFLYVSTSLSSFNESLLHPFISLGPVHVRGPRLTVSSPFPISWRSHHSNCYHLQ
jgi:hypothetical protein